MSDVLNGLGSPQNPGLSSALVEALAAYGLLEPATSLADIQAEIHDVLAREDDPEAWVAASRIVGGQFENEAVLGPYSEAIMQLPERDRIRLLVMAVRTPESDFYAYWARPRRPPAPRSGVTGVTPTA